MDNEITAAKLTNSDIAADGSCARLHLQDAHGQPLTLVLPTACLAQLMAALPRIFQITVDRQDPGGGMRVVHALEGFQLEAGEFDDSEPDQFIITLHSTGGLAMSFSASGADIATMGETLIEEANGRAMPIAPQLS